MSEIGEDAVAAFQVQSAPVRGRYARLGSRTIGPILERHDYARPVALLLGEALTLAALIGSLLKGEGRLTVQAEGEGPVSLLVAEYRTDGGLRGYARCAPEDASRLGDARRPPASLLGAGTLTLTIDLGEDTDQMQGVVSLEGETLAACAEAYFERSEQTPTRVKLAVAEVVTEAGSHWRAGGALIQRIAGDDQRGFTDDDWERAQYLFATLTDAELVDPDMGTDRALFLLFHEDGVRMADPAEMDDRCTCNRERLTVLMSRFEPEDVAAMIEPDGAIHARCQFCARLYRIEPSEIA
jgi:molecular chaperone Hsp33